MLLSIVGISNHLLLLLLMCIVVSVSRIFVLRVLRWVFFVVGGASGDGCMCGFSLDLVGYFPLENSVDRI